MRDNMKALIRLEAQVPVKVFKGDIDFVAHCPIFDVASQGETPEEARKNLIEALTGFFITCYEMGTLSRVLKECGFTPDVSAEQTVQLDKGEDFIDIPLPFMLTEKESVECAV